MIENQTNKIQSLIIDFNEPNQVKDDEVFIESLGLLKLKGTKLKYLKNGDYNNFMIIKTIGVSELLRYLDGEDIVRTFLSAVFDVPKVEITFLEEITVPKIHEIITKSNQINGIKESDFLDQIAKKVVEG